jgi:hypothetical protein
MGIMVAVDGVVLFDEGDAPGGPWKQRHTEVIGTTLYRATQATFNAL